MVSQALTFAGFKYNDCHKDFFSENVDEGINHTHYMKTGLIIIWIWLNKTNILKHAIAFFSKTVPIYFPLLSLQFL